MILSGAFLAFCGYYLSFLCCYHSLFFQLLCDKNHSPDLNWKNCEFSVHCRSSSLHLKVKSEITQSVFIKGLVRLIKFSLSFGHHGLLYVFIHIYKWNNGDYISYFINFKCCLRQIWIYQWSKHIYGFVLMPLIRTDLKYIHMYTYLWIIFQQTI